MNPNRVRYHEMTGTEMLEQLFPKGEWLWHDDGDAVNAPRSFHTNAAYVRSRLSQEAPEAMVQRLNTEGIPATLYPYGGIVIDETALNRRIRQTAESAEFAEDGIPCTLHDYMHHLLRDVRSQQAVIPFAERAEAIREKRDTGQQAR